MAAPTYEWDERKRRSNLAKHGLDFASMRRFDWATAVVAVDTRRAYGEVRMRAFGLLDGTACSVVFTRRGRAIRIISLRRAGARERRAYGL